MYRFLRSSGGRAESLRVGSENMENLMTVVDRLDELQASSVGRRECSSTRQRTAPREPDTWTSMYTHRVSPAHGRRAVATAQAHVMEVSRSRGICAALCIRRTLCRHVTIGTPMVIFAVWLSFDCFWRMVHCTNRQKQSEDSQNSKNEGLKG